jgi:hypothetical protein
VGLRHPRRVHRTACNRWRHFVEDEGLSLLVRREQVDVAGLPYEFVAAWITLTVCSALDAVGLTAEVAG